MKVYLILMLLFATGCTSYYQNPQAVRDNSILKIYSIGGEIPSLSMQLSEGSFSIDPEMIGVLNSEIEAKDVVLPAAQEVVLQFYYSWPGGRTTALRSLSNGYSERIERYEEVEIESCSSIATFTPKPESQYQAYFKFFGGKCTSFIKEFRS